LSRKFWEEDDKKIPFLYFIVSREFLAHSMRETNDGIYSDFDHICSRAWFFFQTRNSNTGLSDRFQFLFGSLTRYDTLVEFKWHTHPSHSQTSRLLTSSVSSGVAVPRATPCVCEPKKNGHYIYICNENDIYKIEIKNFDFIFFFFLVLSGKLGKQSLRFRTTKTFFFGITFFLYQNENPVDHMIHGNVSWIHRPG
jgi:hypothetical protein